MLTIKNHQTFLLCISLYFIGSALVLYLFEKGVVELYFNQRHQNVLDFFFKYWTFIGDGLFITLVIIVLFFYRIYYAFFCLVAILVKTAIVQYLKLSVFHWEPWPKTFFKDQVIYLVDGIEIYGFNSFPSGHTSQAFCMAVVLAIIVSRENLRHKDIYHTGLFLVAFLVGISRIYLMQHFVRDTVAGAAIGCVVAYLVYFILEAIFKNHETKFYKRSILNLGRG